MSNVIVVGSANFDHRLVVASFPASGQTVLAGQSSQGSGGKGANQAVAAARCGARTKMVACLGDDDAGRALLKAMESNLVDTSYVRATSDALTGAAYVMVDATGENSIIVAPGANAQLNSADLDKAFAELSETDYVMLQLEIPLSLVAEAIFKAHSRHAKVAVNVSPVNEEIKPYLGVIDVLIVNEGELRDVAALFNLADDDIEVLATTVASRLGNMLVCTLGASGALVAANNDLTRVEAPKVEVTDTTGAGDAFAGYFVAALATGATVSYALRRAAAAGALAVTKAGALPAMPFASEVELIA
ncbi:MAG: ribokinase [Propionibacteriaceae bacterium]|nr:ribokinase [Propionibacteriaceae bacterium]